MHIHHNPMTSGNAEIHSAGAAEKAAAAHRAAETRRKLLKGSAQLEGGNDAGEALMIGKWSDDTQGQSQRHPRHPQQKNEPDEEASQAKPISVWA